MRFVAVGVVLLLCCTKEPAPVQDPLAYLRVGVDPTEEAEAMIAELGRNGFQVLHRFDESGYVAFDAAYGGDTLVRVVTQRGVALSLQAPDVRWPERLWVELAEEPRLDADSDGRRDVLVSLRERDRLCLGWVRVDEDGYAVEVVRPHESWGEHPCVLEIDSDGLRLVLEVDVPRAPVPGARVQVPIRSNRREWSIDDTSAAAARWEDAVGSRTEMLEALEPDADEVNAARLRAELAWIDRLRHGPDPMLEPPNDGEEAR